MARPQNRKRQRSDELSQAGSPQQNPPAKKSKTRSEIELDAWAAWKYPPEFWDRLSEINLTRRAVEEHNRRTRLQRPSPSPSQRGLSQRPACAHIATPRDLARFARSGGPDLSDLRGYPQPVADRQPSDAMSASRSSRSRRTKSTDPTTVTPETKPTTKTKKSTPYNRDFDLHLTDHGVHPVYSSKKPDLEDVRTAMTVPRPSLSPSKFSDGAFERFLESNERAKDEDDVLANVIPTILGSSQTTHACARNTVFGNLEELTDGTICSAKPDIYYGAHPEQLSRSVRQELGRHIVPSTMQDKPMAPNFFLEVKGPDGFTGVGMRQARYDGAIGSRALHSLQNYGEEEPAYDGNAYTYSSIYKDGMLRMYAHHPTAPTAPENRPEYHMTHVDAWAMVGNIDSFRRGATAFRNVRDLAEQHRDTFIQAANLRASQAESAAGQEVPIQACEDDPTSHESTDNTDYLASQNADDALQQYIAEADIHAFEEDPQELSQESIAQGLNNSSMSFATSFTSNPSTNPSRSKRPRQSLSPPSSSKVSHSSKGRTRPSATRQTAESSTSDAGSAQPSSSEPCWVEAYYRKGKICFRHPDGYEIKTERGNWTEQTVDGTRCFYCTSSKSGRAFWATELPKASRR